jgi:hypothetical protein
MEPVKYDGEEKKTPSLSEEEKENRKNFKREAS